MIIMFVFLGLTVLFIIATIIYLSRKRNKETFTSSIEKKDASKQRKKLDKKKLESVFNFKIKDNRDIFNKVVILIDDVMTTGSTINECKKILKNNGAKRIIVLTIAKSDI